MSDETENRHDILDIDGGYISINRPKDAPQLTNEEQEAFRALATIALSHITEQTTGGLAPRRKTMSAYLSDPDFTLLNCDVLDGLRSLPDESVHCVVTSPPYWGLRDYGTGVWGGGDPACDHVEGHDHRDLGFNERWGRPTGERKQEKAREFKYRGACGKCGARRVDNQLGLEPTPEAYVARMVEVFREVRRVLRADGTLWLNMGDSYSASPKGNPGDWGTIGRPNVTKVEQPGAYRKDRIPGLKPKDLVGIPWRLAFALQADGWYLRSDIIWAKPNPMPESVTDRPTKAHEYVFLLSRSPRYFFDQEAVREKWTSGNEDRRDFRSSRYTNQPAGVSNTEHGDGHSVYAKGQDGRRKTSVVGRDGSIQHRDGERWPNGGRNVRSVWEIATQPYAEAHFATFPEALVERCVKAGCPADGTVLDPFMGSGTTALVARKHGRRSIGIELNTSYCELAARRLSQLSLLAIEHEPAPPLPRSRGLTGGAYPPPGQSPHSNAR